MATPVALLKFYASSAWISFRLNIVAERGLTCDKCGKIITHVKEAHLHHIIELTPANVNDAMISLNPDNVMVLHKGCHDEAHERFSVQQGKTVYLVTGPPGSGKTTFVMDRKSRNDIVLDMDQLYKAITLLPDYDKPDRLLSVVKGVYNQMLDMVRTRNGKWSTAWVIGGYADRYQREKLAEDLGAEIITMDCNRDQCIVRIKNDASRLHLVDDYIGYVDAWFEKHT